MTVNFSDFRPDPEGGGPALSLPIRTIKDPNELGKASLLAQACDAIAVSSKTLIESRADWTMVILEDLKEKVFDLRAGWLRWLLGTAMPLKPDFRLFANGTEVVSSKEDYAIVSEFDVTDLTESRFKNIEKLAAWPGAPTMESLHRVSFPKV
ncbi:MAG: hypothetical protein DMG13_27380 [Acidobacteria bacterium]|nr:MAG: hypothetical protein DMG13_27380 [Acidobacteriota bacterium]